MSQSDATISEMHSASVVKPKRKRNRKKKSKTALLAVDGVPKVNESSITSTAASTFDGSVTSESSTQGAIEVTETMLIDAPLRPVSNQDILRKSLALKGFSLDEIDDAIIEMWDKELPYDDFDAVLAFLERNNGSGVQVLVDTSRDDTEKNQPEETDDSTNNDPSTEDSTENEQGENGKINHSDSKHEAEPAAPPAMTIQEKLDMVARYESLSDSIYALSQWISKAAKPQEIEDLCLAEKTRALSTIIQRGIVECKEQSKFENAVLPGIVRLLFSVYKRCGIEYAPNELEAAENNMAALLRQARKVTLMKHDDYSDYGENQIAEVVARFVVARLAVAMEEAKLARSIFSRGSLHSPPTSIKSRLNGGSSSDIVSKREMQKMSLQRAAFELRSTMNAASGSAEMKESPLACESADRNATVDDALLMIISQETKDSFDQQRTRLEELKAEVTESESEKILELRAAVTSARGERQAVQEKIAELKASLEQLNLQDEQLTVKIGSLEGDISEEEMKASDLAEQHAKVVQEAQDAVKYANSVGSLAVMLNTYGKSIATAATMPKEAALKGSKDADELAVKKMDVYLRDVRSYFITEAQYAGQLVTRLDSTRNDLGSLKSELEQCAGLGMTSTTAQIETSIASLNAKIADDSILLESVSKDALPMFDELISRLQQYTSKGEKESWKLLSEHSILLLDVIAAVKMLDIANWERLQGLLQTIVPMDHSDATMQSSGSTLNSFPRANVGVRASAPSSLTTTSKQYSAPKLTWASGGKASAPTQKTSLLDIQKEELASRCDS